MWVRRSNTGCWIALGWGERAGQRATSWSTSFGCAVCSGCGTLRLMSNPVTRLPIVGVMGSGTRPSSERASALGRWLAECGVHLLTGGGGGVMAAVSKSFYETPNRQGLVIGVLSSDESLEELIRWGEERGWKREYLDLRNELPHFDAFRTRLRQCGEGVKRKEFVGDVRRWRGRKTR